MSVVGGKGDGENIVGVADEGAGCVSIGKFPKTQSLVPRSRKGVSAIGGDNL